MHKVKANALWNELSVKQRKTLDTWLFEEGLSYIEAWERAKNELGFKGSKASVQRYYTRRKQERILTEFKDLRDDVAAVSGAPVDEKELRTASMKVLGQFLFQQVRQSPENVKEWGMVASLIVDNDRNELLRELKGEELKMRRQAMDFAREKFQFDMAKRALEALPQLLELAEAKRDPAIKEYEENIRLNRIMRAMFGSAHEIHPESDQEAAEMLAAKREREARQKSEREVAAERRQVCDELGGAQPPTPSSRYYEEYMEANAEREAEAQARGRAIHQSEAQAPTAAEAAQAEREKLLRELREVQAEREADEQERERALREYQAQASEISDVEQAKEKKLQEQREAERAERKQRREQREAEARVRLEEMREICGWQEVPRPPGVEEES